jgi:hypothetical protein
MVSWRFGRPAEPASGTEFSRTIVRWGASVMRLAPPGRYVFMMFLPAGRFLIAPFPPADLAARVFAAVILPPLLFFAMV